MTPQPSDTELIDNTLNGASDAFCALVRRYQDRLVHGMTHLCGSSDDALDIVQDAFVQAFTKLSKFQRQSAFYTWIYRIAFNLMISRKRRERPWVSLDQRMGMGAEPAVESTPLEPLQQQDRIAQVRAALLSLTDEHRQVLVLREMEGWDYDTMASTLNLPVGTIRSRLHRARIELRELLKEVAEEDLK